VEIEEKNRGGRRNTNINNMTNGQRKQTRGRERRKAHTIVEEGSKTRTKKMKKIKTGRRKDKSKSL